MAQYAIIGIAKLKTGGNVAGALDHMERKRKTENSNGRDNDILIQPPPLPEIMREINSYLPRKNAVLAYDVLLTASPEWFTGKTEEQVKEWEAASLEWARGKFGSDNIKAAIVHRDETTPHIQLLIIPEHKGKLNARHFTGGREKLRALWTEYAQAMKPYGLERGKEYSPAKHQNIKAYYEAVNRGKAITEKQDLRPELLPAPGLADRLNPRQYAAELIEEATENTRQQNASLKIELKRERAERERLEKRIAADRKLYYTLQVTPGAYRDAIEARDRETRIKEAVIKRHRAWWLLSVHILKIILPAIAN